MVAHQTSNGCNLLPGDLIATGTISGPTRDARGCLLEMTEGGKVPLQLPTGESRTFLADGDEVVMRACCERAGCADWVSASAPASSHEASQFLFDQLHAHGVRHIFGIPGDFVLNLYNALQQDEPLPSDDAEPRARRRASPQMARRASPTGSASVSSLTAQAG